MQTAIVGTSTVSITTEDASGSPITPVSVTVSGVAHDGTGVTLSSVTIGSGGTAGTHTATLTISRPTLVTLTWTVDSVVLVDLVDVIGRMPIAVSELKASDTSLSALPGPQLRDAIEAAHEECRRITGRSWVRRYDVITLTPRGGGQVLTPFSDIARIGGATFTPRGGHVSTPFSDIARIGAVTVDGTAWTSQQIIDSANIEPLTGRVSLSTSGVLVEIGVEHGKREPSPLIRLALLTRARQWAQQPTSKVSLYSERVVMDGSGGSIVRMLPKPNSTGVAEIDAIYQGYAWAGGVGIA